MHMSTLTQTPRLPFLACFLDMLPPRFDLFGRFASEWEKTVTRFGRWIDFKNDYKTLDPSFMESVWWVNICKHSIK